MIFIFSDNRRQTGTRSCLSSTFRIAGRCGSSAPTVHSFYKHTFQFGGHPEKFQRFQAVGVGGMFRGTVFFINLRQKRNFGFV